MKTRCLFGLALLLLGAGAALAQQGQNQPLYDPNDPIGRVLPPNLHMVIDISGSMSAQPSSSGSTYDWGGQRTDSKIYITKNAVTNLLLRDSLRLRWGLWLYPNNATHMRAHDVQRYYNEDRRRWYSNYQYFPTNLYSYTYSGSTATRVYDTYVISGSGCSGSKDRLLAPIEHHASDPDQWFKSSVDSGYTNRTLMRSWMDRTFNRTIGSGCISVPGLGDPFLTEFPARGSTPISHSLESILQYTAGKNRNGANSDPYYFDYTTGTEKYWTDAERDVDIYYNCRFNAILLLTDGMDTCEGTTAARNVASALYNNYDVSTYVVGFALQGDSEKATLNNIAASGGTTQAYFADNEGSLLVALEKILGTIGSEISGDTEPILGFIKPTNITWPVAMPDQVLVQNMVIKTSTSYSPVFKGHMRCFQAITTSATEGKINFLTDFTVDSPYLLWDFADYLDNVPHTAKTIYTFNGTSRVAFTSGNYRDLNTMMGTSLSSAEATAFVNWVRSQPLGSILYSTPAFVGPPDPDTYATAEYMNWADDWKDRTPMILVGANDGMLHCINAETGEELWAVIPPSALSSTSTPPAKLYNEIYGAGDPASQGQPDVYGTRIYNRRPHYYYIASSPKVIDARTAGGEWKTLCVFGLGAGGREYYCLDITDPEDPQMLWSFAGVANNPLGETWSVPALGRFGPVGGSYPHGVFGAVFGSGFNLNPAYPNPTSIGKSVFIVNLTETTAGQPTVMAWRRLAADTSQTQFGATPTSLVSDIGNCFFAPPVLYESPTDLDDLADKIYIGDYDGDLYRVILDPTNLANSTGDRIFRGKNGTPIYSVPYVAEYYFQGAGKKTLLAFTEYGRPADAAYPPRLPGVTYVLVEENLPNALVTAGELVASTGTGSSFNPATSKGFYYQFTSAVEGESSPFRPTIFWNDNRVWMGVTSYKFFPNAVPGYNCDPETHTVGAGHSMAYIFNLTNGNFFNTAGGQKLGEGTTFYGRASAFHKGARGEGWLDIGTGEMWGWGYSQSHDKFEKFDAAAGNLEADMNPTASVEIRSNYWREFK